MLQMSEDLHQLKRDYKYKISQKAVSVQRYLWLGMYLRTKSDQRSHTMTGITGKIYFICPVLNHFQNQLFFTILMKSQPALVWLFVSSHMYEWEEEGLMF